MQPRNAAINAHSDSAFSSLPIKSLSPTDGRSNLPPAFLDEPTGGWDARALYGDDQELEPDQDEIDTVRIIPMLAGEEPDASLLERAEPIQSPAIEDPMPTESDSTDETVEILITKTPPLPPELLARLRELHRRGRFSLSPTLQLKPWWLVEQLARFCRRSAS